MIYFKGSPSHLPRLARLATWTAAPPTIMWPSSRSYRGSANDVAHCVVLDNTNRLTSLDGDRPNASRRCPWIDICCNVKHPNALLPNGHQLDLQTNIGQLLPCRPIRELTIPDIAAWPSCGSPTICPVATPARAVGQASSGMRAPPPGCHSPTCRGDIGDPLLLLDSGF